jgi:hypothetical protein
MRLKRSVTALTSALLTLALLVAAATMLPSSLQAQSFYGSVVGTVTDSSGAVVPGATVTLTNTATAVAQKAQTDSGGKYSFVNLVPADYKIDVSKANFKRFERAGIPVQVGSATRIDASLTIGNVSETVQVTTSAPLLQTDSSSLSQEIEGQQVQEEPLNGRNVMNLIALAPGVVPTGGAMGGIGLNQGTRTAGGAGWGDYQIGGAIQGQSGNYIDGVANNLLGGNVIGLVPTQDAIQEFNVASSNAGADFGRYSGGVVNMTTRTGGNAWHGSVWEYNRNRDYNANDYFSNLAGSPRAVFNQNQYGASASGPIIKNKVFFMFTWESYKALTGNLTPTNVPTLALQNGVFANGLPADPLGNCTIAPYTGQTVNGMTFPSGGSYITNLGTGSCGDPTNLIMKQFYPLPNSTLAASNWFLATGLGENNTQYNARVDYELSSRQRIFGRYTYWNPVDSPHNEFLDTGYKNGTSSNGTTWPTHDGKASYFTTQAVVGDTITLNPTTVLDVRLNFVRQYAPNLAEATNLNESQFGTNFATLGAQMDVHLMPAWNASGGTYNLYNMGNYPNDGITWYNTYGFSASLTKILGSHSLKIGAEAREMDQSSVSFNGGGSGSFNYNNSAWMKDEWANFLLGYSTSGTFKSAIETAAYMYYQGYYLTDTWNATRSLTINAGLRYELPGAVAERQNRAAVLLPNATEPTTGILGTEAMVASSLYAGRTTLNPVHNLFAPNIGFAYRASSSTVLRGGYGISYLPNDISGGWNPNGAYVNGASATWSNSTGSAPVQFQTNLATVIAGGGVPASPGRYATASSQPTLFMTGGVPFLPALVSKTSFLNKSITGAVPYQPYPWTQHWNAALSHQFKGNTMVEVSYSGLKGINLPEQGNHNLNELADSNDAQGAALAVKSACAAANGLTVALGQCLRQYPYYNNVSDSLGYFAIENYSAFMVKVEKRMGANGVISGNYTHAKNQGDTDTQASYLESKATTQGGSGNGGIQDWNNLGGEYSLISYDVTNRMVLSYVLKLPFGKGQKYANSLNGIANTVASGWSLNGITTFQSGFPVFLASANGGQLGNYGGGTMRPMMVPGCSPKIGGSGLARVKAGAWFNTSCFSAVNQSTLSNGTPSPFAGTNYYNGYQFGNEPRVDPTLRSDGQKNFDMAIGKSTPIFEKASLAFKVEFFNIMNRVQFAPPGPSVNGGGYGAVSYQVNKPRQLQMSMRVNF